MSLFSATDIDQYIITFLNEHDLTQLSGVNRYYNSVTKPYLQDIITFFNKTKNLSPDEMFTRARNFNKISVCKYLFDYYPISNDAIDDAYEGSAQDGNLDMIKWLHPMIGKESCITELLIRSIMFACGNSHEDIAIWIREHMTDYNDVGIFIICCEYDCIKFAKYLVNKCAFDIMKHHDKIAKHCCEGSISIEFMEWLVSMGLNINYKDCILFRCCCRSGNLKVAKWLYNRVKIDMYAENYCNFIGVCEHGHLNIAKWMFSINDAIPEKVFQDLLPKVCNLKYVFEWISQIMTLNNYKHQNINDYKKQIKVSDKECACMPEDSDSEPESDTESNTEESDSETEEIEEQEQEYEFRAENGFLCAYKKTKSDYESELESEENEPEESDEHINRRIEEPESEEIGTSDPIDIDLIELSSSEEDSTLINKI